MIELFLASIAALILLYLPGYFLFRAIRCTRLVSLIAAPIASLAPYGLLPVLYYNMGIECNLATIVLLPLVVYLAAFIISCKSAGEGSTTVLGLVQPTGVWRALNAKGDAPRDWAVLALYVFCGIVACSVMFVAALGAPDAFFSRYDNQTHLNVAQAFIDSGQWSSLHAGRYLASLPNQTPYPTASGFYPATFHALIALIFLLSGVKVTIATNALVAVCAAVVFPDGMYLIIRTLFPDNRVVVLAGALVTVGFSTYPWFFALKGPTFPQMLAFAVMVAFIGLIINWLEQGVVKQKLPGFIVFAAVSFISLTFAHTNALFTAFVFLAAYGGHYIWRAVRSSQAIPDGQKNRRLAIYITCYLVAIAVFWAFCLTTPILHSVVGYVHREHMTISQALVSLVTLRMGMSSIQFAMVACSIAGAVVCIRRRMFWPLIPVLYMCIAYFFTRWSIDPFTTIFAGLWYSLPYRAGECLCLYLMPVASLGLAWICETATGFFAKRGGKIPLLSSYPQLAGAIIVLLLVCVTFPTSTVTIGGRTFHPSFASMHMHLERIYAQDENRVYGAEEVAFVDKALELIPEGALVVNSPNDGSLFAYGVNHMNTYFRASAVKHMSDEATIIRKRLIEYTTNADVRKALETADANYVLLLDQGVAYEDLIKLPQFYEKNKDQYRGIDDIRDDTPGFTVLLAEGDMRLYRIDR